LHNETIYEGANGDEIEKDEEHNEDGHNEANDSDATTSDAQSGDEDNIAHTVDGICSN
jgi:hypothetical protein